MVSTLTTIAKQLKDSEGKVQLIYAFNGTGKTRLSVEFQDFFSTEGQGLEIHSEQLKLLYYNAFTEDLFYWENQTTLKLKIRPNGFTDWILNNQGLDREVVDNFQKFAGSKMNPIFDVDSSGVAFAVALESADQKNIKISKGEESNFIWSIFYTLLDSVIQNLNETDRGTTQFNELEYIFIDDPVTSLDENHLIELAVALAELIKKAPQNLKFIVTTHNPLFYNVMYSHIGLKRGFLFSNTEDGNYNLAEKKGSSNQAFAYHLHLKNLLEDAIEHKSVKRYHFNLLRNLYEKTACFLGYKQWCDLLNSVDGDKEAYLKRIINFSSHSRLSSEEFSEPSEPEKQTVKFLLDHLVNNYGYFSEKE